MKVTMLVMNSIWFDPRVRKAAETAMEEGIDVTVIGIIDSRYNKSRVDELKFRHVLIDTNVGLQRSDISIFKKIQREMVKFRKMKQACILTEPEVIHANDLDTLPVGYSVAKKMHAALIYDSHEIYCENERIRKSKIKYYLWKTIEKHLIKKVDSVISVSHSAAKVLTEMYKIEPPIVVTNAAKKVIDARYSPRIESRFEILIHGKFYEGRGYDTFIRCSKLLSKYTNIHFVIRGMGPLEDNLRKLAHELDAIDNLTFDPPVPVSEMVSIAARSHVGIAITEPININFTYTVSNKLFEYAAAGLPVIMSDVPEHRLLNTVYNFGLILENNSVECLSNAIIKLYEDRDLYSVLQKNAIILSEKLNWENEFKKVISLYQRYAFKSKLVRN